jgi:hypothetical protein
MPLPTVLMTDCIRSAHTGESHGGAYLVDLERGSWRKVLDWNNTQINWEGRGSGRGLRGIAIRGEEILIAASDELFVFDLEFKIKRSYRNPFLGNAHEVFLDGDTLYIASTAFDSVLAFDIPSGRFTRGWAFRLNSIDGTPASPTGDPSALRFTAGMYDPATGNGPPAWDSIHLNNMWLEGGRLYFSGVGMRHMLYFEPDGKLGRYGEIPDWTHNSRPYRGGVLCNSTGKDAVCHLDLKGHVLRSTPVPRYDESLLQHIPRTKDVARQAFGRGLVVTADGLIIGGSSPATVSVHDLDAGKVIKSINVTMDIRNAPHGLAIWPF